MILPREYVNRRIKKPGLIAGKHVALRLARCARVPRATARQASLILAKGGCSGPPFCNSPTSRACRPCTLPTLTRGGRAFRPWAGARTLAGASCVVASCRTCLPVTDASLAVWADGSSLTRWAGQAAHTVGRVRGAGWTPRALPHGTGAA